MSKMKSVLINRELKEEQMKRVEKLLSDYTVYTNSEVVNDFKEIEIIIHWNKEMNHLWKENKLPNLKWVQVISAGINYVPLEEFREKGVVLSNASGIHQYTISEHVIGVLLYHMRDLATVVENQKNANWNQDLHIQELHGKTMIIVGAGNIGQQLASVAKALGMRTIGVNRSGKKLEVMDETITQNQLKDILSKGDIIVSILPETEETLHYFSREIFATMKKGVQFVNVGRGSSVVEQDLLEALDNGIISFAALDVFQTEPLEESSPLWKHEKVLITPHVSGMVEHFRDALFAVIEPNIKSFLTEGKPCVNFISNDKNY